MELKGLSEQVARGRYPAGIYSDGEIFKLEQERVFARTWQYLAHESEIPDPGDYVVRRVLADSFIVVRDEEGRVQVLLNMCRHRGMQVCRADAGNASHFRCPYHAWVYRNDGRLVGIPFHQDAYGGEAVLSKAGISLARPARVGTYKGLVFVSLDPSVPELEDWIGDFRAFLDMYVDQSEAGIEVRGPQRWIINANWKIGAENFAGDSYHTPHTHASVVDIGLFHEPKGSKRKEGALYWAGSGGGTTYKLPAADFDANLAYLGYPPEMVDRMRARWGPEQKAIVGEAGFMVSAATLFPNLSFVHNWPRVHEGGGVVPFISIRLWLPLGPTSTEVWSWFAVDRLAPEWYKADSYRAYLMCFGSSGMFEQDDVENWTSITAVARGRLAAATPLESTMGLNADGSAPLRDPLPAWPGPGQAFTGYGEYNQRNLLGHWARCLEGAR